MNYLPAFEMIKRKLPITASDGVVHVNVSYEDFLSIVKEFLRIVPVDEEWYCTTYPDIRDAIASGACASARAHFVDHGYFEGRLPYDMEVDEEWYLRVNEDVAARVRTGELRTAKEHFVSHGYIEGRRPMPATAEGRAAAPAVPSSRGEARRVDFQQRRMSLSGSVDASRQP
jgi:hypothetical protein